MRFLAVVAVLLLAGCLGWTRIEVDSHVDNHHPCELAAKLAAGDKVEWSWSSNASVEFQLVGTGMHGAGAAGSGSYTAVAAGNLVARWETAATAAVRLNATLRTTGEVTSGPLACLVLQS